MKKFFHIPILLVLLTWCFGTNSFAQYAPSTGLAPSNHVINPSHERGAKIQRDGATTGYGVYFDIVGFVNQQFFSVPIPDGTPITPIGTPTTVLVQGGDFGEGGVYYGTINDNALVTYDISTGVQTTVASITGVTSGQSLIGLGYYPATNTMYLATTNITTSELYTLDVSSGVATLIGTVTNCPGLIAIGVNCDGEMYGVDLVNDNLVSIDPSTAAGTIVGPLGYDANYAQDADFDFATGTLYIAAYNGATGTGELRTADLTTGNTTFITTLTGAEVTSFGIPGTCGAPCPVESASNPNPATGAGDVDVNLGQLTWDNGAGAVTNEVYFGTSPGSLTLVQSGTLATSWTIDPSYLPLDYATTYYWKVIEIGDTCNATASTWNFTTMQNPNLVTVFMDDFESGCGNWTITNDGGTCVWDCSHDASEYMMGSTGASGFVMAADADFCGSGSTLLSTATLTNPIDATTSPTVYLEFDEDWRTITTSDTAAVEVSTDGGATWMSALSYDGVDARDTHAFVDLSSMVGNTSFMLRFRTVMPGWDWWWAVDNVMVQLVTPVEMTSFTANVNEGNVSLNWSTATETNNKGFDVQRRSENGQYETIAFVDGNGTSTEKHNYSYVDTKLASGNYTYRLKQVDFDGKFAYSKEVNANVELPAVYSLEQNYPNPFNPSTQINFSLAVDSRVSLKVFDVLGRQVAELVNNNLTAGQHNINFNASNLSSGVYFYRLEAKGVNGKNFTSIKKMILTK